MVTIMVALWVSKLKIMVYLQISGLVRLGSPLLHPGWYHLLSFRGHGGCNPFFRGGPGGTLMRHLPSGVVECQPMGLLTGGLFVISLPFR